MRTEWIIFAYNAMFNEIEIPEPFLFNPLKHHLMFLKEFMEYFIEKDHTDSRIMLSNLKHIGTSVMDVYTRRYGINRICCEAEDILRSKNHFSQASFAKWCGTGKDDHRIIRLPDDSEWTLKCENRPAQYIHIFPSRNSTHTFRVKGNTLKSALIYNIMTGKDLVTGTDLNRVRVMLGLSPVKDPADTMAILGMIEILRS
jgi:hypothetical protein